MACRPLGKSGRWARQSGIHIIALTADAMSGADTLQIEAGMNDYVSKARRAAVLLRS